MDKLISKIKEKNNPSIVGLDPVIDYVPKFLREKSFETYGRNLKGVAEAIFEFNKAIIDKTYDIIPAIKPQSAYYEMYGMEGISALHKTIDYAKSKGLFILLDVKRNDIGSTAAAYSSAYIGETVIDGDIKVGSEIDAITVNPYLGSDGLIPFLNDCKKFDKDMFVLVKTSNPSSGELQDLCVDNSAIYEKVAHIVNNLNEGTIGEYGYGRVGAVVGGTYPEQTKKLRQIMKEVYFLVPGYGAQGGKAKDVANSFNKDGLGAIVNSSRGVMLAYKNMNMDENEFDEAARLEVLRMRDEINSFLG